MLTAFDPVIAGFAKESDMGSKPIFESTAGIPEPTIVRHVRSEIHASTPAIRAAARGECEGDAVMFRSSEGTNSILEAAGGGGATTCLEETIGSPAKETTCDAKATTARAINRFIGIPVFLVLAKTNEIWYWSLVQ